MQRQKLEYLCGPCHEHFATSRNIRQHIREIHESTEYHKCDHCPSIFPTRSTLVIHCQELHDSTEHRPMYMTDFEKIQSSIGGFFRVYESIPKEKEFDLDSYLIRQENNVRALVDKILGEQNSIRMQMTLLIRMIKELEEEETDISCHSLMETIYQDGMSEELYTKMTDHIIACVENFCQKGSGWIAKHVQALHLNVSKHRPIR